MTTFGKQPHDLASDMLGTMNYSNSAQRIRPPKAARPEEETVFSLETDKRGTHLRVRKVSTLARRALRPLGLAAMAG